MIDVETVAHWSDELRAIANDGLTHSTSSYERHRLDRLLRVAARMAAAGGEADEQAVEDLFRVDFSHQSPYLAGDAAIFDDGGRVLLIRRRDNRLWAMPGGMLEVGETPAEGTCREAIEETGVRVEPVSLVGVYDSRLCGSRTTAHLVHFVFRCRPASGAGAPIVTEESVDVGWFDPDDAPPLSPGHTVRLADATRSARGDLTAAVFDRPAPG